MISSMKEGFLQNYSISENNDKKLQNKQALLFKRFDGIINET